MRPSTTTVTMLQPVDVESLGKALDTDLPLNGNEKSGSDQQKIGIWGKKSGSWSNRLQKEITHPKRRLFVV